MPFVRISKPIVFIGDRSYVEGTILDVPTGLANMLVGKDAGQLHAGPAFDPEAKIVERAIARTANVETRQASK